MHSVGRPSISVPYLGRVSSGDAGLAEVILRIGPGEFLRRAILAHGPAFSIEEHANLPIAIPDPRLSHLPHALPESGARIMVTAIAIAGPRTADNPAGAPLTDRVRPA